MAKPSEEYPSPFRLVAELVELMDQGLMTEEEYWSRLLDLADLELARAREKLLDRKLGL